MTTVVETSSGKEISFRVEGRIVISELLQNLIWIDSCRCIPPKAYECSDSKIICGTLRSCTRHAEGSIVPSLVVHNTDDLQRHIGSHSLLSMTSAQRTMDENMARLSHSYLSLRREMSMYFREMVSKEQSTTSRAFCRGCASHCNCTQIINVQRFSRLGAWEKCKATTISCQGLPYVRLVDYKFDSVPMHSKTRVFIVQMFDTIIS